MGQDDIAIKTMSMFMRTFPVHLSSQKIRQALPSQRVQSTAASPKKNDSLATVSLAAKSAITKAGARTKNNP